MVIQRILEKSNRITCKSSTTYKNGKINKVKYTDLLIIDKVQEICQLLNIIISEDYNEIERDSKAEQISGFY